MAATLPPIPWDRPSMSFEWVDWYTRLRDIIDESALDHNALLNLQGGNATEHFHLTAAQHLALTTNLQQTIEAYTVPTYALRYDEISSTEAYAGEAEEGSPTSGAVWRIKRLTFGPGGDVVIEWADGNSNFDNVWDNRLSLSYS